MFPGQDADKPCACPRLWRCWGREDLEDQLSQWWVTVPKSLCALGESSQLRTLVDVFLVREEGGLPISSIEGASGGLPRYN